jgi:hypothetical protein
MTTTERVGLWFLLLALAGMTFVLWAAANKRTDDLSARLTLTPSTTTTSTPTTRSPLDAEVQNLKKSVLEIQANRGLTGPEVRALVETLLPAETCPEPPCAESVPPTAIPVSTTTTEQKRRHR